jgi:hypothetical protein
METRRRLVLLVYDALSIAVPPDGKPIINPPVDCGKNHSHFQRSDSTPKLRFATDREKGEHHVTAEGMTAEPMKRDLSKFFPSDLSKLRPVEAANGVVGVTAP